MRTVVVAALFLPLLLAGCSVDTHRPSPTPTHSDSAEPTVAPQPETDNVVFLVGFHSDGAATVQVPFPHLDSCIQPEDWMNATTSVSGAVPDLKDASDGRTGKVLSLAAPQAGEVSWQSQINGTRHVCETFRFDPWSTEPDPQGDAVDVHANGPLTGFNVLVRWIRDGCGNATRYDGDVQDGSWSTLQGKSIPAGCPG